MFGSVGSALYRIAAIESFARQFQASSWTAPIPSYASAPASVAGSSPAGSDAASAPRTFADVLAASDAAPSRVSILATATAPPEGPANEATPATALETTDPPPPGLVGAEANAWNMVHLLATLQKAATEGRWKTFFADTPGNTIEWATNPETIAQIEANMERDGVLPDGTFRPPSPWSPFQQKLIEAGLQEPDPDKLGATRPTAAATASSAELAALLAAQMAAGHAAASSAIDALDQPALDDRSRPA